MKEFIRCDQVVAELKIFRGQPTNIHNASHRYHENANRSKTKGSLKTSVLFAASI